MNKTNAALIHPSSFHLHPLIQRKLQESNLPSRLRSSLVFETSPRANGVRASRWREARSENREAGRKLIPVQNLSAFLLATRFCLLASSPRARQESNLPESRLQLDRRPPASCSKMGAEGVEPSMPEGDRVTVCCNSRSATHPKKEG